MGRNRFVVVLSCGCEVVTSKPPRTSIDFFVNCMTCGCEATIVDFFERKEVATHKPKGVHQYDTEPA